MYTIILNNMGNTVTAYYYSKAYNERDRHLPLPSTKPKDNKTTKPKDDNKSVIGTDKSLL